MSDLADLTSIASDWIPCSDISLLSTEQMQTFLADHQEEDKALIFAYRLALDLSMWATAVEVKSHQVGPAVGLCRVLLETLR